MTEGCDANPEEKRMGSKDQRGRSERSCAAAEGWAERIDPGTREQKMLRICNVSCLTNFQADLVMVLGCLSNLQRMFWMKNNVVCPHERVSLEGRGAIRKASAS